MRANCLKIQVKDSPKTLHYIIFHLGHCSHLMVSFKIWSIWASKMKYQKRSSITTSSLFYPLLSIKHLTLIPKTNRLRKIAYSNFFDTKIPNIVPSTIAPNTSFFSSLSLFQAYLFFLFYYNFCIFFNCYLYHTTWSLNY